MNPWSATYSWRKPMRIPIRPCGDADGSDPALTARLLGRFLGDLAVRQHFLRLPLVCLFVCLGCGMEVKPSLAPPRRKAIANQGATSTATVAANPSPDSSQGILSGESGQMPPVQVAAAKALETGHATRAADSASADTPELPPRLVADRIDHDFDVMDPHTIGTHIFTVRNEGNGPLRFLDHRSDCKCTVGRFPREPIPPGGEAEIEIEWKTQSNNERFEHSATVETNDPETPQLTFTIRGNVLVHAGASPPQFAFSSVRPGVATESTSIISSQVWESFEIRDISSSLDGLTWQVEPATSEELESQRARCGYRLTVRLPDDLDQGPFTHEIRFHLQPSHASAEEAREYRLPVTGKVLRRLAVYGPGIDRAGNVSLGVIDSQKGHTHRLIVKVYDQDQQIRLRQSHVHPDFLKVRLMPYATAGVATTDGSESTDGSETDVRGTKGLYRLEIEVPAGTLPGRYLGGQSATVHCEFDHPRISELQLRLQFTVAGPSADGRQGLR